MLPWDRRCGRQRYSTPSIDDPAGRFRRPVMNTMNKQGISRFPLARWSPIALRAIVGFGFIQHGFAKLSRGPDAFAAILQSMSVPHPHLMAWLTTLTELSGGLALLLGAFVPIVSLPMTAVLLVAIFKVHLQYGFSSIKLLAVTPAGAKFGPVGYEVAVLYIAWLAALVLGGPGPLSIHGLFRHCVEERHDRQVPDLSRVPHNVVG